VETINPVAPFARSPNEFEQLTGVFYIAVLSSRLIGLCPMRECGGGKPERPAG
jgi:hypothetical protein